MIVLMGRLRYPRMRCVVGWDNSLGASSSNAGLRLGSFGVGWCLGKGWSSGCNEDWVVFVG